MTVTEDFVRFVWRIAMDRRQQKTRKAIFDALGRLLERKRFENLTVQEIIDEANIGRSTFYAHFETKDDLLKHMCTDIFQHIFTDRLPLETEDPYSAGMRNLELKLGHILYHLGENRNNLKGILGERSKHHHKTTKKTARKGCLLLSHYKQNYLLDNFFNSSATN